MVVQARRVAPTGRVGRVLTVSDRLEAGIAQIDAAVGGNGDAVITWGVAQLGGSARYARRLDVGGTLGGIRTLHGPRPVYETDADVAIDGRGRATVVWSEVYGERLEKGWKTTRADLYARRLAADGKLGPIVEIPPGDSHDHAPRIAVSAAGTATVAWHVENANGLFVRAVTLEPGRGSSSPGTVSAVRQLGPGAGPEIVPGAGERSVVAWNAFADDSGSKVLARSVAASGRLGALRTLVEGAGSPVTVQTDTARRALLVLDYSGQSHNVSGRRMRTPGLPAPVWRVAQQGHAGISAAVGVDGRSLTVAWTSARYSADGMVTSSRALSQKLAASGRPGPVNVIDRSLGPSTPTIVANAKGRLFAVWGFKEVYAARFCQRCADRGGSR